MTDLATTSTQIDALERSINRFVEEAQKREVGVFIPIPSEAAAQFPSKDDEDKSPPHITVLYAGDLSDAETQVFTALVRAIAHAFAAFPIEMTDYGEFVNDKGQTIAHMIPRSSSLELLHRAIRSSCEDARLPIEHKPGFKSHATLAYVEKGKRYNGPRPTAKWTAREIEVWDGDDHVSIPLGAPAVFRAAAHDQSPWVEVGNEHKLCDLVQPIVQDRLNSMAEACALEGVGAALYNEHDRALADLAKQFGKIMLLAHLSGRAEIIDAVAQEPIARFSARVYARDDDGRFAHVPGHGKRVWTGPNPADLPTTAFIPRKKTQEHMLRTYLQDEKVVASSRTTPQPDINLPIGTWRVDEYALSRGADIEQLLEFDPRQLVPTESPRDMGRGDDIEMYKKWFKEGKKFPPIHVLEREDGSLAVTDGHRRWTAAKELGVPIRAWVSPCVEIPGLKDADGKPMKQGLTRELAIAWKAIDAKKPIPKEITDKFPSIAQFSDRRVVSKKADRLASMLSGDVQQLLKAYVEKYGLSAFEQEKLVERYALGRGFDLARAASDAMRKRVRDLVLMANAGIPQPDVVDLVKALRKSFTPGYSKMVVHNGVTSAYNAGRFRMLRDPEIAEKVAGLEFIAVDDDKVRPHHLAADGMFATPESPVWGELTPPLGHFCRCGLRLVTKSEARRRHLKPTWSAPRGAHADEGFGQRPEEL